MIEDPPEHDDIPNVGDLIEKTNARPDEPIQDGAPGRVVRRLGPNAPALETEGNNVIAASDYGFIVDWAAQPGAPSFIAGSRIRKRESL